jgi:hypothetical protein
MPAPLFISRAFKRFVDPVVCRVQSSLCVRAHRHARLSGNFDLLENERHMTDATAFFDPPHDYVDETIYLLFF